MEFTQRLGLCSCGFPSLEFLYMRTLPWKSYPSRAVGTDVPESISPFLGLTLLVHGPLAKPWLVLQSMDRTSRFCAGSTMLDDLDLGVRGDGCAAFWQRDQHCTVAERI